MKESRVPLVESSGVSTDISAADSRIVFGYAGAIGNAVDLSKFNGSWSNYLSADDDDDLDGFTDFTLEMWTRQEEWGGSSSVNPILLAKRSTTACSYHWYCKQVGDSRAANMVLSTNVTAYSDLTGNTTSPILGQWTHQAYVRNTSENHIYSFLNGAITYTRPNSFGENTIGATDERLSFGSGNRGGVFPGQIDEVRISRVARSSDWIKATHDCVTEANFATYSKAKATTSRASVLIFN